MDALAPAPTRATNNITLRFPPLVSLNVQFFTATEDTKVVERHTYNRATDSEIGYKKYDKVTGKDVADADCAMKVLVGEKLVELTEAEMLAATAGSAVDKGDVEVSTFVPVAAIGDKYLVDTGRLYQVRPAPREVGKKKLPDPQAQKLFALLLASLAEHGVAALLRVGLRGTARHALLCADGFVRFVYYPDEVRAPLDLPDVEISDGEREAFGQLIEAIGTSTPDLVNDAKEAIAECLVAKAAGLEAAPVVAREPEAEILDLTAALAASVEAAQMKKAS